jgi:uncharacterized protein (DUF362 family)
MNRRDWMIASAAMTGSGIAWQMQKRNYVRDLRPKLSRVAILSADKYSEKLHELVYDGLRLFKLDVRGKSVLLKPNIVEYIPGQPVNTHPHLIGAAADAFRRLGAGSVTVGEGPGHHRDTRLLLYETGLGDQLAQQKVAFVDLNRDELIKMKLEANYSGLGHLWLPRTVLASDFIVSMPKVKTHHWTGVTLSMKNMFGIVPGCRYGWPKNVLHWAGIHESILDICATVPPNFVIADGIVAMDGDGPLNGSPRYLNMVFLADDPVAADATLTRLIGLGPEGIPHIREANRFIGNLDQNMISELM